MKHLISGTKPTGAYSPAVVASGTFLFVSGQGPLVDGVIVPGSIAEQTRLTLHNIEQILEQAGLGLADVVRCGVFLADIDDFAEMDAAYGQYFGPHRPARTTVGAALAGIGVEIDCIALAPEGWTR